MSIPRPTRTVPFVVVGAVAMTLTACGGDEAGGAGGNGAKECGSVQARASHHISAKSAAHKGLDVLAREVSDKTEGRVTVEVFSDAQLGGLGEMGENLRSGAVEIALVDSGSLSRFDPGLGVFDLPFLFEDMEQFNTLLDGEVGDAVNQKVEAVGVKPLYWSAVGLRDMFFVEKEVRSVNDLSGLKMRVPEAPVWVDTFKAFGTSPTAIPAGELYTALDTGVVDGFEFPLGTAVDLKMYEPVNVWTPTGHILTNILIAASPSFVDELCEEDRNALLEAAQAAQDETRKLWREDNEAAKEVLTKELTVIDDVQLDGFKEKVAPVHSAFTSKNGAELYDKIKAETTS
jgi:tripartite ATP-independent transporter DctP family solute receptor